jgi:hypothetical protein
LLRRFSQLLLRQKPHPNKSALMLPQAQISHYTVNRLRIKIPSKRGQGAYFTFLKENLSKYHGIEEVRVNPMTGSVLLLHNLDATKIAQFGTANNLFLLHSPRPNPVTLHQNVVNSFGRLNEHVKASTGGELDIPSLAFLGLIGAGIYQLTIGNFIMPSWYTAFWYATSIVLSVQSGKGDDSTDNSETG